ncbi:MAG: hypothetical protein ABI914_08510 [Acidobacteriota bacterium]
MKRIASVLAFSIITTIAFSASSSAQDRRPSGRQHPPGSGFALGHLRRCLSAVDLTADQQSSIEAILSGAQATLPAEAQSMKAARQKVESDLAANADPCVIGADVVARHAGATKLRADVAAVRDQVFAKLTPDQQNRVQGCFQERRHRR